MKLFVFLLFVLSSVPVFAQGTGKILIVSDLPTDIIVDAEKKYSVEGAVPFPLDLPAGQHVLQNLGDINEAGNPAMEIIQVEEGKQVVIQLTSSAPLENSDGATNRVNLVDTELVLTGGLTEALREEDADYYTTGAPVFRYYFQAGDRIKINVSKEEIKGTHAIAFVHGEDNSIVYSENIFTEIKDKWIDINRDGVYILVLATNYAFDRTVRLSIDRYPNPEATAVLNSRVELKYMYEPVVIMEPTTYIINGSANAEWAGGKNQIVVPVTLPANTVEWYYTFAASEDEARTEATMENFSLASSITSSILQGNIIGGSLSAIFDMIKQPAGSEHCDVKLIDHKSLLLMKSGQPHAYYPTASRENMTSGKVRVNNIPINPAYLLFENPRTFNAIAIGVEIVAVTATPYYASVDAK